MGKPYRHADHERKRLSDPLDENATLLYFAREDKILGTLRIDWGEDLTAFMTLAKSFHLGRFNSFPGASLSFFSLLMVHKDHRSSAIAAHLSIAAYQLCRDRGVQFNFVHCVPRLLRLFERMGFRQYKQHFQDAEVGEQGPLVLVVEDIEHLKAIGSPFVAIALALPNNNRTSLWFTNQFPATQTRHSKIKEK